MQHTTPSGPGIVWTAALSRVLIGAMPVDEAGRVTLGGFVEGSMRVLPLEEDWFEARGGTLRSSMLPSILTATPRL